MLSTLFYINQSIVNMREHPTNQSKVVSQALFSEPICIEKEQDNWFYITTSDGYPGWIASHTFVTLDTPYHSSFKTSRLAAHIYEESNIEYGPAQTLPYGSKLQACDTTDLRWIKIILPDKTEYYIQKGDIAPEKELHDKFELTTFSQRFLGLPYTWGGRSSFGYDCSGFVQMLYQQIGINLLRDAKQQVLDARFLTIRIEDLEPGDLIFFGTSDQHIRHVGMALSEGYFIHSTARENQPWIRISHLSDFEWSGHFNAHYPHRIARQQKNKE